MTLKLKISYF